MAPIFIFLFSIDIFIYILNNMKTILVTGASKGLGELIVNEAILRGYFVVFTYNKNKKKAQKIYFKNKGKCLPLKLDLYN